MNDVIYLVLTNNDLLKEITKWHILDHLDNDELLIKILCQEKNIDNLMWLLNKNYITMDILDKSAKLHIPKLNYFDHAPSFLDLAYFVNNSKITKYFNYDTKCKLDLIEYTQEIFNNHSFIRFYNFLPDNNLFNNSIYHLTTYNLHDNIFIKKLFDDMNYDSFNHCITIGDYGTQYNLDELHFNDDLLKFLIKGKLITLDFLDNIFVKDNTKNIVIRKSIAYLLYKNFSETLKYVLYKCPGLLNNDIFKDNTINDFLLSHNIETVVVLLENNISALHNECIEYLFKYKKFKSNIGLGNIYTSIYNTFNKLKIYSNVITLIDNSDILTLEKIHEYIKYNKFEYTCETTNNIIMCYSLKFIEHFNTLIIEMKNECSKYLIKYEPKLMAKIILDTDINIGFNDKVDILIENNMYDYAYDYISNYEIPEIIFNNSILLKLSGVLNLSMNILKLPGQINSDTKRNKIYDTLQKMHISKKIINLIEQNKIDEWSKIYKYLSSCPIEFIDELIYDFIDTNKVSFVELYKNWPQITNMKNHIHNILSNNLFHSNNDHNNNYNKTIHTYINNYCIKIAEEQLNNIVTCYTSEFVDNFKSLSKNMKNKCLKYLLKNKESGLLSKIILDKDIVIEFNVKLKILLEFNQYEDAINCILFNDGDKYEIMEKIYNSYTKIKTNPDKQNSVSQLEDNILINNALNESEIHVNIQNLLEYVYNKKTDIINVIKILFSKVHIQDKILIITNLPKSLDNFYDIFVMLCDTLFEEIFTYHKMLYCIKNHIVENIINDFVIDDNNVYNYDHDRHINKIEPDININDFIKCLLSISDNNIPIQTDEPNIKITNTFPSLMDNILLKTSNINFMDLAYNTILNNQYIMNFVNEYNLNIQSNKFTTNYIIKNIVIQNMLNKGTYDKYENITYKMIHMTPNIYKKNCKIIDVIINNVIIPDHNMLLTIYNYSNMFPKCFNVKLKELQTFLQFIQTTICDDDIYNNFLYGKKIWDDLNDQYLIEYFLKNNMPKCLNIYLNNCNVKYYESHIKMAKKSELLNILVQHKNLYLREYMPFKLSVKVQPEHGTTCYKTNI